MLLVSALWKNRNAGFRNIFLYDPIVQMAHWLSCWVGLWRAGLHDRRRQGAKQPLQVAGYIFAMTADGLVWKPYIVQNIGLCICREGYCMAVFVPKVAIAVVFVMYKVVVVAGTFRTSQISVFHFHWERKLGALLLLSETRLLVSRRCLVSVISVENW